MFGNRSTPCNKRRLVHRELHALNIFVNPLNIFWQIALRRVENAIDVEEKETTHFDATCVA